MPQLTMTTEEFRAEIAKGLGSKYRNQKVTVDGIRFDSQHEAAEWFKLVELQKLGLVKNLVRQYRFILEVSGQKICTYVADFDFWERSDLKSDDWTRVTADAKGFQTSVFKLKAKLFKALYGREIRLC